MDTSARLQIPDPSIAGPSQSSRQTGSSRPVSANVYSSSTSPSSQSQSANPPPRKRASHQVTSSQQQVEEQPIYRNVYAHPAAVAYAAAHPRRTIPKFGPYLLLQTLGEGEFGKVKLGLHGQWGEEVAVKLIRRGNIDTAVRMSKVEREIEVLRTIKHPNIVRLYDVIETDKYIGIILEYASGGELFDHILAHRYLKEKDACKLFSQLISGVWYIHQKKIVHRDLKLENLLLDRNRNVIITDFGFANRFEHRSDDLMQTSCGSPCYAAPELVISEGLYVGSAVDIWSCGVILYAMLAGYLPFDDDPANPDGDNINLLYKYIVNTPLTFPDYVSAEARELLSMMLVPDPERRADLQAIMAHSWLQPYAHLFERSVADVERSAMEQHQMKRLAYQRQMKQQAAAAAAVPEGIQRSHSARTDIPASTSPPRTRQHPPPTQSPVFLYETAADGNFYAPSQPSAPAQTSSRRHAASAVVMPSTHASSSPIDDDPFGPPPSQGPPMSASPLSGDDVAAQGDARGEPRTRKSRESTTKSTRKVPVPIVAPVRTTPDKRKADRQRHTIQLEYNGNEEEPVRSPPRTQRSYGDREPDVRTNADTDMEDADGVFISDPMKPSGSPLRPSFSQSRSTPRVGSVGDDAVPSPKGVKPLPSPPSSSPASRRRPSVPSAADVLQPSKTEPAMTPRSERVSETPIVSVAPASPTRSYNKNTPPSSSLEEKAKLLQNGSGSTGSAGSGSSSRHRKGISVDKFVGKLWGNGSETGLNRTPSRVPSNGSAAGIPPASSPSESLNGKRRSSMTRVVSSLTPKFKATEKSAESKDIKEGKKSRRNTLTVMVEPFSRQLKQRSKGRSATGSSDIISKEKEDFAPSPAKANLKSEIPVPLTPRFPNVSSTNTPSSDASLGMGIPASTSKASRVMQWFRYKSKGRAPSEAADEFENVSHPEELIDRSTTPTMSTYKENAGAGTTTSSTDTVSRAPVQVVVTTPTSSETPKPTRAPSVTRPSVSTTSEPHTSIPYRALNALRTVSAVPSVAARSASASSGTFNKVALRVHQGAVDQTTVTTRAPPEVMALVTKVLLEMGMEVQQESEFKYRCIRPKKKKAGGGSASDGLTAYTMVGSAASNGVDKRGLPLPSPSFGTGGMLRSLLMRRQSSQVSASGVDSDVNPDASNYSEATRKSVSPLPGSAAPEPTYGDRTNDQGDEVRFSVELTRIEGLDDTFSLDIRRLKGSLRSYKFLYDALRKRCDLQR